MDKNKFSVFNLSQSHKEGTFIREVLSYVDDFKNEK